MMDNIITKAFSGNKSALTTLYNSNKDEIYSIAFCLLQDKEKAEKIVLNIFSTIWDSDSIRMIQTEEDFSSTCRISALNECKKAILKTDSKAFQTPKNKNFVIAGEKKTSDWKNAISEFSTLQKFIFISRVLGKVSSETIAKIVCVDLTSVKLAISTEKINLDKVWSLEETEKNLVKDANQMRFHSDDVTPILSAIDKYAEPFEKLALIKKIRIATTVLIVCLFIALIFALVIIIKERPTEPTNSNTSTSSTASNEVVIDNWVTSVKATDYAVIDVKDYGKISIALDSKTAPISVENFKKLANKGYYDGLTFHRIIEGFMMQGGSSNGTSSDDNKEANIKGEFAENGIANNLSHVRGAISMARANDNDSGSTQFFIVHKDSTFLDKKYAAFGYVVEGMEIVDKICTEADPTDNNGTIPAKNQPIINSVKIYTVEEFESIKLEENNESSTSEEASESEISQIISEEPSKDNISEESQKAETVE